MSTGEVLRMCYDLFGSFVKRGHTIHHLMIPVSRSCPRGLLHQWWRLGPTVFEFNTNFNSQETVSDPHTATHSQFSIMLLSPKSKKDSLVVQKSKFHKIGSKQ